MDFLTWFTSHGGYVHPSAELVSGSNGHKFLQVRQGCRIQAEEKVILCPHDLILSLAAQGKNQSSGTAPAIHIESSNVSRISAFRLRLMKEYVIGEQSSWYPYIKNLPQPCERGGFSTPLYFSPEDRRWLDGTNLGSATDARQKAWAEDFRCSRDAIKGLSEDQHKLWTCDLYNWAATVITTRSFPASASSNSSLGLPVLIPGLDLLNHSPFSRITWDWWPTTCAIRTDEELLEGSQIFNNYGPKENEELLMGYGFCLDPNPADTFNLSYSPALVKHIELTYAHTDLQQSAVASTQPQGTHSAGLLATSAGNTPSEISQSYSFSQGFLTDFSLVLRNKRERDCKAFHQPPPDSTSFSLTSLTRNKFHVLSSIMMVLQDKKGAIRKHDRNLPTEPQNQKQEYAAVYRKSQLRILEGVLNSLESTLLSITMHSRPSVEVSSNASRPTQGTGLSNFVVTVRDIVGATSGYATEVESEIQSLRKLTPHLRPVIHAGLRTRDPSRIIRRNGEEFAFTIWIFSLWLLVQPRLEADDMSGLEPALSAWLQKLEQWYAQPSEASVYTSSQTHPTPRHDETQTPTGASEDEDGTEKKSKKAKLDKKNETATTTTNDEEVMDLFRTTTSYVNVIHSTIRKYPDSFFNRQPSEITPARLAWCLAIVRGEGVRVPGLQDQTTSSLPDPNPRSSGGVGNAARQSRGLGSFRLRNAGGDHNNSSSSSSSSGKDKADRDGEEEEDDPVDELVMVVEAD